MNNNVITDTLFTDLINNSYNDYNYYNAEDLDFTLNESLSLLNNEIKRLEKKIIVTQITLKYNGNNRGYWVDEDFFEVLNTDLVYYKEKYECVRSAILNILIELKNNDCIKDENNNSAIMNTIKEEDADAEADNEEVVGVKSDADDEEEDADDEEEETDDEEEEDTDDEIKDPPFVKAIDDNPILQTPFERFITYLLRG